MVGRSGCVGLVAVVLVLVGCGEEGLEAISGDEARVILAAYVNGQLEGETYDPDTYSGPDYSPEHLYPQLKASDWDNVDLQKGRWVVEKLAREFALRNADDALYIRASVDINGNAPRLEEFKWMTP